MTSDTNCLTIGIRRLMQSGILAILTTTILAWPANASEFRRFNPILTKESAEKFPAQNQGASQTANIDIDIDTVPQPSRFQIEEAIHTIAVNWNNPKLRDYLADNFYDKERLLENISFSTTQSAELRVISIQNPAVLNRIPNLNDQGELIAIDNLVNAVVRFQVVLLDQVQGQVIKDGTSEFTLKIQQVRR